MRTYRRLDEPTRYYGLSWRGWLAAAAAGGLLYLFIRLSPFDARMTISVTLIACVLPAMAGFAAGGQALGIGRYLGAVIRWAASPKDYGARPYDGARLPTGGILLDPDTAGLEASDQEASDGL